MEKLKEFAKKISGCEYHGPTDEQIEEAKELGIVIVYGASDDLMEFRGAIYDEFDCYGGRTCYLTESGELYINYIPHASKLTHIEIEAVWCDKENGWTWSYTTNIPHATFEMMDGDEKYCLGIVFYKKDLEA